MRIMPMNRSLPTTILISASFALSARTASAHPSSGIVIDPKGQVYFQDIVGRAIWKIDAQGKLTKYHDKLGGHWMALDSEGSFSRARIPYFERITPDGEKPALVVADGGSPIAVTRDGHLYYLCGFSKTRPADPGGPLIGRMSPEGNLTVLTPSLRETAEKLGGITGLAAGPDGCLYAACPSAVLKVGLDETASTLVHPVALADCDEDFPDGNRNFPLPALRGLAVDPEGTVYAAATGCHRVVRIGRSGKVEVVLKAERPWSPTAVAVHQGELYVLEYTNANGRAADGWTPRVRKLSRDGKVTTLATVPRQPKP
jgi:sugar lactone lactonase YvrE